jgi:hypothetical protein
MVSEVETLVITLAEEPEAEDTQVLGGVNLELATV